MMRAIVTDLIKPIKRKATRPHQGRSYTVVLMPGDVIGFRPERSRKIFYVTLAACYDLAVRQTVAAERATRRKRK